MNYPKVFGFFNDYGENVWMQAGKVDTPTHQVVPLTALVIEPDNIDAFLARYFPHKTVEWWDVAKQIVAALGAAKARRGES